MKHIIYPHRLHCCFIYSCPTVKINSTKYMWYPVNSRQAYFSLDRWLVNETPGSPQGRKIIIIVDTWSQKQVHLDWKHSPQEFAGAIVTLPFQLRCKLPSHLLLKPLYSTWQFIFIDHPITDFRLSAKTLLTSNKTLCCICFHWDILKTQDELLSSYPRTFSLTSPIL